MSGRIGVTRKDSYIGFLLICMLVFHTGIVLVKTFYLALTHLGLVLSQ